MMAIVTGGTDYTDANRIAEVLDAAVTRLGLWCIIVTDASGAPALAMEWARKTETVAIIHAPGERGPIENKRLLDILRGHDEAQAVFCFPGFDPNMVAQAWDIRIITL